jgi:hypothetical protein
MASSNAVLGAWERSVIWTNQIVFMNSPNLCAEHTPRRLGLGNGKFDTFSRKSQLSAVIRPNILLTNRPNNPKSIRRIN